MRPELARLVLALVKPVRLVWPRLDEGLYVAHVGFMFGWTDVELIAAMPRQFPVRPLLAVVRAVAADDVRRLVARHGVQR